MPGALVFDLSSREHGFDGSAQMLETALGLSPAQPTFCLLEKMWTHLLELPNCLWVMLCGCCWHHWGNLHSLARSEGRVRVQNISFSHAITRLNPL